MYKRLMDHLLNNILPNSQFGIEKNSSTLNAAYKFTNDIFMALNNKRNFGGIFFDLEYSFNCVDHNILLTKKNIVV
jgi:hypothetical protein